MDLLRKTIALLGCLIMVLTINAHQTLQFTFAEQIKKEEKIYSCANIEDDFVDNHVMVVLNHEASMRYLESQVIDFTEVKAKCINNISQC